MISYLVCFLAGAVSAIVLSTVPKVYTWVKGVFTKAKSAEQAVVSEVKKL